MGRIKADPVDIAFRAWAQLDDAQKQRLADRVAGYQTAAGIAAPWIAPAPRTRQRKAKANGSDTRVTTTLTAEDMQAAMRGASSDIPPKRS